MTFRRNKKASKVNALSAALLPAFPLELLKFRRLFHKKSF